MLAISNAKKINIVFRKKYTKAILSNSTRELMLFEITETLIALLEVNLLCFYDNFRQTFLPYFSHGDKVKVKVNGV